jgi:CRISPR-associated exonuclease Cas4
MTTPATNEQPEFIPLAMLNAYAYCPRRFYYEFALGEMVVNEHVLEGQLLHERVDQPGTTQREQKLQWRRVYLCAPKLGLIGYTDLLEVSNLDAGTNNTERTDSTELAELARAGKLYPVEYKKGKVGKWLSDHTQLCAQALALEEALELPAGTIVRGFLFYFGSARREEVGLDAPIRERTLQLLADARQVAVATEPPPPVTNRHKCRDCSLEPICLPQEIRKLQKLKEV